MTLKADAAQLLKRLRNAYRMLADSNATHNARRAAEIIAADLVDEASPELLRAALTAAVQPDGGQPPIPVVLGPQDAAMATVGVDDVMALAYVYLEAGTGNLAHEVSDADFQRAHDRLRAAVEQLALGAFVGAVGRAHSEGRLS